MPKNKWGRFCIIAIISVVIAIFSCSPPRVQRFVELEEEFHGAKRLTIFHTSDNHARGLENDGIHVSFASLATFVDDFRHANPATLFLNAGDSTTGLPYSNSTRGLGFVNVLNQMGYDAIVLGNHEFDYGFVNLQNIMAALLFPVVLSNVAPRPLHCQEYIIKDVGDIRVGIIGVLTQDMPQLVGAINLGGLNVQQPDIGLNALIQNLKHVQNVDVIVVLAHIGLNASINMVQNCPDIDVVIDGHDHSPLAHGRKINHSLIANAGCFANYLGEVILGLTEDNHVEYRGARLLNPEQINTSAFNPGVHAAGQVLLNNYQNAKLAALPIIHLINPLQGAALGNVIARSMQEHTGADIALIDTGHFNGGHLAAGGVTEFDIAELLPFDNNIVTIQLTGNELMAVLNHHGRYPKCTAQNPAMGPIQPMNMYTLATTDFLSGGGNGYGMLKNKHADIQAEKITTMVTQFLNHADPAAL